MGLREALRRRSRPALPGANGVQDDAPSVHRHTADPRTGLLADPPSAPARPDMPASTNASPPPPGGLPDVNGSTPAAAPGAPGAPGALGVISSDSGLISGTAELRRAPEPQRRPSPRGPSAAERATVRRAWDAVGDRADEFVRMFYAELFLALGDDALSMFPSDMAAQRHDFGATLVQWVVADDPEALTAQLDQLGDDHRKFDVEPGHYEIAATALLNTWRRMAGSAWDDTVEQAVVTSYNRLAAVMLDGADRRRDQPAWWGATVVAHERRERDFAVVRIQPDAPYSFRPGQYLTLELAGQPRRWRQMSFASAPRPDNTFDIQVRAVAATGVSGALVAHTAVGDRLRLGPPRGNDLVVEAGTASAGLLAICAGTGAAPVTAVVEALAARPDAPPVYAFVGGRSGRDLHAVGDLERLVAAHGAQQRVHVYGVAAEDVRYPGFHGRIEEFVAQLHPWAELGFEVLVAGPDSMTAATIASLRARDVPAQRIHFDQYIAPE